MTQERTGYPSVDKPWLKYYDENAWEKANDIPLNKTVWDVIEESFHRHFDVPAIEYFGRVISRKEFIENVYLWARVFRSLGVRENEVVAYYGPFTPDVCYMTFALNVIGACPYFLKLAITPEALAEETKDCRFAIVFDQMWENVRDEFCKEKYDKVIFVRITDGMPLTKRMLISAVMWVKSQVSVPKGTKYLSVKDARKLSKHYAGDLKIPFVANRNAFITSSSGTTVGGLVKGTVATNESAVSQLFMADNSQVQFFSGDRCLNHFPPTASTSLDVLFLFPLFFGMTIVLDPRVSEKDFYRQLINYKPNVALTTGNAWAAFFARVQEEMKAGKKFDFGYAKFWCVGGEGAPSESIESWRKLMFNSGEGKFFSGYGCSELFSVVTTEMINGYGNGSKSVAGVGIPFAGMTVGVFDKNGQELSYNQRGELRIKSKSAMKEYYNKPEITALTKVDGWIRSGDLAEIDENGFVYIWGRITDKIALKDGREIYLFDVAQKLMEKEYIKDALVLEKPIEHDAVNLVAHIVWNETVKESDRQAHLLDLYEHIKQYEPMVNLCVFAYHEGMLPYSPTTLKKDRNRMFEQSDNYCMVETDHVVAVRFTKSDGELYSIISL